MNQQKKFNMLDYIILGLMVSSEAVFKVVADLIIALPALGQIVFGLSDLYTFLIYGIIVIWFVFKMGGFGKANALYFTVGGIFNLFGIPLGLAGGVITAVYLANHPKVLATAEVVAAPEAETAGEIGAAAEAGEAAEVAASAEQAGTAAAEAGTASQAGGAEKNLANEQEATGEERGGGGKQEPEINPEAFGVQPEPMEELQQQLTGKNPVGEARTSAGEGEAEQISSSRSDNKSDLQKERLAKEAKAEQLRRTMEKLPQGQDQQTPQRERQGEEQQNDDDLAAAAGYQ
jgi:hypothetical protein